MKTSIYLGLMIIPLIFNGCIGAEINEEKGSLENVQPVVQPYPMSVSGTEKPAPYAMNPEARTQGVYHPLLSLTGSGEAGLAGAALVGAVMGISQILKTPEKRTDLQGSCVYGEPENSAMVSPCVNVKVSLVSLKDQKVASSSTNQNGDFRFFIPPGESYFVQVEDRKGRKGSTAKPAGRSSQVVIYLKP